MASCIGSGFKRQATTRPFFSREIRPASESTSRCFMTAGSDTGNGFASSLIETLPVPRRARIARRVESESAEKVRSNAAFLYLTIWFSI